MLTFTFYSSTKPGQDHVPFARDHGQYERLLTTFSRLIPSANVSMEQVIEREDALFSPGTAVIVVSAVQALTTITVEQLLDLRSRGITIQCLFTGEPERKTMAETHDLPVHYVGGREKWHALIRAAADEKG